MPPGTNRDEDLAAATGTRHFGRSRRLRRPTEFAAVLAAPRAQSLRAARHWLSMTAAWTRADRAAVRFGATVGKRNARRAVDRNLVKRVLREAGRHAAPALEALCVERGWRLDVAFRLKAVRSAGAGRPDSAAPLSLKTWRRALRGEADGLLDRLRRHLASSDAAA